MNDQQIKDLFATAVSDGPADLLDVDRAITNGRRRRRIRAGALMASIAAVLLVVAGAVGISMPKSTPPPPAGTAPPTPTPSTSGSATAMRTLQDWGDAVERSMRYAGQVTGETPVAWHATSPSATLENPDRLSRSFHYTRDGRTTLLRVWVEAPAPGSHANTSGTPEQALVQRCHLFETPNTCDPVRETQAGPVIVVHSPGMVSAVNLRSSGIVVIVASYASDFHTPAQQNDGTATGPPGMADELDLLVSTAVNVPVPAFHR